MPAMILFIKNYEIKMMNAGGGDGGSLANDDIINMFGNNKELMIVDDAGLLTLMQDMMDTSDNHSFVSKALVRGIKIREIFALLRESIWYYFRRGFK